MNRVRRDASVCENSGPDDVSGIAGVVVFPKAEHGPVVGFEGRGDAGISHLVGRDLLVPIPAVGCGPGAVDGASMPKAAIDVYGDPAGGENDVRPNQASSSGADREVHPIPEAKSVQGFSQGELRSGVAPSIRSHDRPTLLWDALPGRPASITSLGIVATHRLPSSLGLCR
jgi:hypothetical protein